MKQTALLFLVVPVAIAVALTLWFMLADSPEQAAVSDQAEVRKEAARRLEGKAGQREVAALRRLARDSDPNVAVQAVRSMARKPHPAYHAILLEAAASSGEGLVRGEAAAALGRYEQTTPGVLVEALQKDPSPAVRAGAAEGLEYKNDRSTIPALLQALDDPEKEVRASAIGALTRMVGGGVRFDYRAEWPAEKRREKIAGMRVILRKWGFLPQ